MSQRLTVDLEPAMRAALGRVLDLLERERSSVSSVRDPALAWRVHVADSLSGLEVDELAQAARIADIGSGAGFPGLALAVAMPGCSVDLVESVRRKCDFITRAIGVAGAQRAKVVCERSEDWAAENGREAYDAVTARAVGRLSTLAELASPMLRDGGVLVAWKGRRDAEEEAEASRAADRLGMAPERILPVGPYAGSRHRHLHVLRKNGPTPSGLPRRPGLAKKRPFGARRASH